MFTITKADRKQFPDKRPIDYGMFVLMWFMLAMVPVGYIYYLVECMVRR